MQQTSAERAVETVNALLHLHPDDQSRLLDVIHDYFTSRTLCEESDSESSDDSDDNETGTGSQHFHITNNNRTVNNMQANVVHAILRREKAQKQKEMNRVLLMN